LKRPERRQLVLQLRAFVKKALLPPGRAELWPFKSIFEKKQF
jgi:hypothetical protein